MTQLASPVFAKVTSTLVDAFVQRAQALPVAEPAPAQPALSPPPSA